MKQTSCDLGVIQTGSLALTLFLESDLKISGLCPSVGRFN